MRLMAGFAAALLLVVAGEVAAQDEPAERHPPAEPSTEPSARYQADDDTSVSGTDDAEPPPESSVPLGPPPPPPELSVPLGPPPPPAPARPAPEAPWRPSPQCADTHECKDHGECSYVDGDCVAGSDVECWESKLCREQGRCVFNPERQECDDGTERYSAGLVAGGIPLIAVGGACLPAGLLMLAFSGGAVDESVGQSGDPVARGGDDGLRAGGIVSLVGGAIGLAAGIVMVVVGKKRLPRSEPTSVAPTISVGPAGGSLTWSF